MNGKMSYLFKGCVVFDKPMSLIATSGILNSTEMLSIPCEDPIQEKYRKLCLGLMGSLSRMK